MARPISPYPYKPKSYQNMRETLATEVENTIRAGKICTAEITARYPSVRDSHIKKILNGCGSDLGIRMLFGIAEAVGVHARLEVSA
jgi:hypothetical protein